MQALAKAIVGLAAFALGAGAARAGDAIPDQPEMIEVVVPALEGMAVQGQVAFVEVCARCHGRKGGGLEGYGPPLISDFYGPSERSDMQIVLAIQLGHVEDNWTYGPMPPAEGLSFSDQGLVVEFLRQVQIANGVE